MLMDSLHSVVPRALTELFRQGPMSQGKLEVAWRVAVGDALARVTTVRLQPDGVVEVQPADQRWNKELKRSSTMILTRLIGLLGDGRVSRVAREVRCARPSSSAPFALLQENSSAALKTLQAPQLGAVVVREAVARAGVDPAAVEECIMGNVLSAGVGQAPARQAALNGGLSNEVAALTINKVCGSGLKAVMLAAQGIALGDIDIAVAGGMESMSNAPYLLSRAREGLRMGDANLVDSMIHDGLWCAFEHCHMGMSGEHVAEIYGVPREEQDRYAAESHQKAARAAADGRFAAEIVPVEVPQPKGSPHRHRSRRNDQARFDGRRARRR